MSRVSAALRAAAARTRAFLARDVWDADPLHLPRARRALVRAVRVLQLVLRGFNHDQCVLHASSLTFVTLLSFVPVLAIGLSMARAFGNVESLRDTLKTGLRDWAQAEVVAEPAAESGDPALPEPAVSGVGAEPLPADPEASPPAPVLDTAAMLGTPDETVAENTVTIDRIEEMIDTLFERIERLNFGALGGIGVAFLLWTVISVIGQVESSFNRVWGVTEQRPLYRKFTDYLSVVVVVPLLVTAASTIPATSLVERLGLAGAVHGAMPFSMRFVRTLGMLALLTLSLTFTLRFLPNTRVRLGPAFGGGVVAALGLSAWLRICLTFQIGLAKYSAFFGSFAMVPILLFWVYVSWIILLVGAEFSFGLQNADTYRMESSASGASARTRLVVALDLLAAAARSVRAGDGLLHLGDWSARHRVPVRLVNDTLRGLVRQGLLAETADAPDTFAIRFDPGAFTAADALRAYLDDGDRPGAVGIRAPAASPLSGHLDAALAAALPRPLADLPPDALL